MVFSLEKKKMRKTKVERNEKKIQMSLCKKAKQSKKKCSASLIYRTSFKYFVSLSLHRNHPQPEMRFAFFIVVC